MTHLHEAGRERSGAAVPERDRLTLPCLFTPLAAAQMLRGSGLTDMTECALRTRAYRKQVPFHRNGRRIVLTDADLRRIAEGQPRRPARPPCDASPPSASP